MNISTDGNWRLNWMDVALLDEDLSDQITQLLQIPSWVHTNTQNELLKGSRCPDRLFLKGLALPDVLDPLIQIVAWDESQKERKEHPRHTLVGKAILLASSLLFLSKATVGSLTEFGLN